MMERTSLNIGKLALFSRSVIHRMRETFTRCGARCQRGGRRETNIRCKEGSCVISRIVALSGWELHWNQESFNDNTFRVVNRRLCIFVVLVYLSCQTCMCSSLLINELAGKKKNMLVKHRHRRFGLILSRISGIPARWRRWLDVRRGWRSGQEEKSVKSKIGVAAVFIGILFIFSFSKVL